MPTTPSTTHAWLERAWIEPEVSLRFPSYRVALVAADRLVPGPSDDISDRLLGDAVAAALRKLSAGPPEQLPHVEAWREAYRAFGAKPSRTRPSVEALLRRIDAGLPRVDRLTDAYNAVSIEHVLPVGGEDLAAYSGPIRLVRATGAEPFDTVSDGQQATEYPLPGEIVWRDDLGVTCRRWNWRQCVRTRITDQTTSAIFVLDSLDPMTWQELAAAASALTNSILLLCPEARTATRYVSAADADDREDAPERV